MDKKSGAQESLNRRKQTRSYRYKEDPRRYAERMQEQKSRMVRVLKWLARAVRQAYLAARLAVAFTDPEALAEDPDLVVDLVEEVASEANRQHRRQNPARRQAKD
ncbi:hypothetical protein [Nannocystis pusilla]|uniref:hypothetical protein n=1 Tax=Nannocystis pusilla TaxID=889268 RepID=UPI003B78F0D6